MFSAILEPPARKFIEKLRDRILLQRLLNKIEKLKSDPFPPGVVRVEGYHEEKVFRVRVGDYRILYFVNYEKNVVDIMNIDKRPRAY